MIAAVVAPVDQRYDTPPDAVSVTLPPAQNVVAPLGVIVAVGSGFTTSVVEPAGDGQPFTVTVTKYVPATVVVGFCAEEVKPPGPVHEYVAPATAGVESVAVPPVQIGPLFDAVGVAGVALTISVVEPAAEVQPVTVTVTK